MQSQKEARAMNLFRLAAHEVAHALVSEQLGIRVRKVRIDTDAARGSVGSHINPFRLLLSANYRKRVVLVSAAGEAAERLQFGEDIHVNYLAAEDVRFSQLMGADFEESVFEVTELVEQHLGEIIKIARRICKTIGGQEGEWKFAWADLAS